MIDILIVSLAWDYEMTGPNIRVFSIAKYLAKYGKKVKVTLINNPKSKVMNGYETIGLLCLPFLSAKKIKKVKGLTFISTLISEIPYSIQIFHLIIKHKPQIVLVEETHSLASFLLIILKFLCRVSKIPSQIILDKHNVIYSLISNFDRQTKLLSKLKILVYFLEKIGLSVADKVIVVSETDKRLINKLYGREEKIFIIPNGVDLEKFKPNPTEGRRLRRKLGLLNKRIILFLGGLNYLPNLDAAEFFINKILPKVKEKIPNCVFVVVGRCPKEVYEKYKNNASIVFTDFVENEVPYINMADICVAPLRIGSGTRLKILSYMACGKVVVSTPKGAEGLNLENYKDIIIVELKDFLKTICYLLKNPKIRKKISRNAILKVKNLYSWDKLTEKFMNEFEV